MLVKISPITVCSSKCLNRKLIVHFIFSHFGLIIKANVTYEQEEVLKHLFSFARVLSPNHFILVLSV